MKQNALKCILCWQSDTALSMWPSIWRRRLAVFTKWVYGLRRQWSKKKHGFPFLNLSTAVSEKWSQMWPNVQSEARHCLLVNSAERCVDVKCCSCFEHFNNSIWQCPQVKDMPRTPQTVSMSFSNMWEFSHWWAFAYYIPSHDWLGGFRPWFHVVAVRRNPSVHPSRLADLSSIWMGFISQKGRSGRFKYCMLRSVILFRSGAHVGFLISLNLTDANLMSTDWHLL